MGRNPTGRRGSGSAPWIAPPRAPTVRSLPVIAALVAPREMAAPGPRRFGATTVPPVKDRTPVLSEEQ